MSKALILNVKVIKEIKNKGKEIHCHECNGFMHKRRDTLPICQMVNQMMIVKAKKPKMGLPSQPAQDPSSLCIKEECISGEKQREKS